MSRIPTPTRTPALAPLGGWPLIILLVAAIAFAVFALWRSRTVEFELEFVRYRPLRFDVDPVEVVDLGTWLEEPDERGEIRVFDWAFEDPELA